MPSRAFAGFELGLLSQTPKHRRRFNLLGSGQMLQRFDESRSKISRDPLPLLLFASVITTLIIGKVLSYLHTENHLNNLGNQRNHKS